jgi:hypothetical protein
MSSSLSEPVKRTLRVLMAPPHIMRTMVRVAHTDGPSTNLVLELSASRNGGLSVLELCPDGELLTGREIGWPEGRHELGHLALWHAMHMLWDGTPAGDLAKRPVVSISCVSAWQGQADGAPGLAAWQYNVTDGAGLLRLIREGAPNKTVALPGQTDPSVRALVERVQEAACIVLGELSGRQAALRR